MNEVNENEPSAPRFYAWEKTYPHLSILIEQFDAINNELLESLSTNWNSWPEKDIYKGDWKFIPLMHSFDPNGPKWLKHCEQFPKLINILKTLPGIKTALFSKLGRHTKLSKHQGWASLSNHILRCHLPIIVPAPEHNLCGIWVDSEIQYHKPKEIIVFDDSKVHYAFNATKGTRIILIIDFERPENVPKGNSEVKNSDELVRLIESYN